jgi:hypothetical protein
LYIWKNLIPVCEKWPQANARPKIKRYRITPSAFGRSGGELTARSMVLVANPVATVVWGREGDL